MHIQAKLVNLLKQDKIQLWNPPYTTEYNQAGQQPLQVTLARSYSHSNCVDVHSAGWSVT